MVREPLTDGDGTLLIDGDGTQLTTSGDESSAGVTSMLAFWMGGYGRQTPPNGMRSLAAFWIGGASGNSLRGGYRSMLAFWGGGATNHGTAIVAPPEKTPEPPPNQPAGAPHRGHYAPNALGRARLRDLYEQRSLEIPPGEQQAAKSEPKLTAPVLAPLPIDFGAGQRAILGIRRELERQQEQILLDDEEAIMAIILAALANR